MEQTNLNVKVKVFNSSETNILEERINDFLKDKILVDIKMSAHKYSCTVIVMYKEFPF